MLNSLILLIVFVTAEGRRKILKSVLNLVSTKFEKFKSFHRNNKKKTYKFANIHFFTNRKFLIEQCSHMYYTI